MTDRMDDIARLVELQALDNEIARLQGLTRDIPVAIEERAREFAAATNQLESLRTRSKEALKKRHTLEKDLVAAQTERQQTQTKLLSIKTNREYSAALAEIEVSKAKESGIEDAILAQMDTCDRTDRELSEGEKRLKGEDARIKDQQEVLRQELVRVEGQLRAQQEERGRMVAAVPADLLARYERIRGGKGGLAVVAVSDNVCGGCFRRLPPQVGLQVRLGEDIQYCQFCGRILHPGEGADAGSGEAAAGEGTFA